MAGICSRAEESSERDTAYALLEKETGFTRNQLTGNTIVSLEEVIIHELMHIKMYPLDQVTESLITNCFEEGSAASAFAYQQFFSALEQTVEELAKCFS